MPAYCTIEQLRAEGLTAPSDARLTTLIARFSAKIDTWTGWWFDAREKTLRLDGRGTKYLHLPAPIIGGDVDEVRTVVRTSDPPLSDVVDPSTYLAYGRAADEGDDDRFNPKLVRHGRMVWAKGLQNYEVDGTFGFVVSDGEDGWLPPPDIVWAVMQLCINWSPDQTDELAREDRRDADLTSLSVQGRSKTWGAPRTSSGWSGDIEVDRIIAAHRCPMFVEVV